VRVFRKATSWSSSAALKPRFPIVLLTFCGTSGEASTSSFRASRDRKVLVYRACYRSGPLPSGSYRQPELIVRDIGAVAVSLSELHRARSIRARWHRSAAHLVGISRPVDPEGLRAPYRLEERSVLALGQPMHHARLPS